MKRSLIYGTIAICFLGFVLNVSFAQDNTDEPDNSEAVTDQPATEETPTLLSASGGPDYDRILPEISLTSILLLVSSAVLGGLGGFGAELLSTAAQDIEIPHGDRTNNRYDPGFWARVFLGAITAILGVYIIEVQNFWGFVAISLAGGVFAVGVLETFESRFKATLERKKAKNLEYQKRIGQAEKTTKDMRGLVDSFDDRESSGVNLRDLEPQALTAGLNSWFERETERQSTISQMRDKLNQLQGILSTANPDDEHNTDE